MPAPVKCPGVYVQEAPSGVRSIEGVATSVTAFVGSARKGPLTKAVRIQSFAEFVTRFGALQRSSELGYAIQQFFLNGGSKAWIARVARAPTVPKIKHALRRFDAADLINLVVLPGVTDIRSLELAEQYCRKRRAFLIADSPPSARTPAEMRQARQSALLASPNAAVYFPWINVRDSATQEPRLAAPSGTMAGVFARTDRTRGVWKAPAGNEAALSGVESLDYNLTDAEIGFLNPTGVNCLRTVPSFGPVAWGARTLGEDEWKYIPVRRLALFIEESIDRGTHWTVFEPNGESLWSQLRASITGFLNELWRNGALVGATPHESFFVKCNRETMTQRDLAHGKVKIIVGFAALKPAEFLTVRFCLNAARPM